MSLLCNIKVMSRDRIFLSHYIIFLSRDKHVDLTGVLSCCTTLFECLRHNLLSLQQVQLACRGGGRSTRLVRPFKKNLNLTIIGPTRTLKIQGFDHKYKDFGLTKVGLVGSAPPALACDVTSLIYCFLDP